MNDTPTDPPTESPASPEDAEILVGQVDATFEPLRPEEIAPASSETDADKSEAALADDAPPPLETAPASSADQHLLGCLRDILLVLISVALGAALALILLLGLNGTLFLNDREKTAALEVSLTLLKDKQAEMKTQIDAHQNAIATIEDQEKETNARLQMMDEQRKELSERMQTLENEQGEQLDEITALWARSDEVEQATEAIRQSVADVSTRVDAIQTDVAGLDDAVSSMQSDIEDVKKTAERFDRFVQGLLTLIADVVPEDVRSGQAMTETASAPVSSPEPPAESAPSTPEPQAERQSPQELFPPRRPIPTPARGSGVIFGLVWEDANGNGQPDADEAALPGARALLMDVRGIPLLSMTTGVDGRFAFIDMPPGEYQVQVAPPAGQDMITPYPQTIAVTPDASIEVNFGLVQP